MKKTKFKKNAQKITHKPETCPNSGEKKNYYETMSPAELSLAKFINKYRGYYTVSRRYEFYVRVARTVSHE